MDGQQLPLSKLAGRLNAIDELAERLYEGVGLENLAESLARSYGKADALSFYRLMGEDVQNFWRTTAKQLIDHAKEWLPNDLSHDERRRLRDLPRVAYNTDPPE